ncbi:MAG: hypothetical protein EXR21_00575 [Flavobacteriaceae bacterium]|nr:hypothetical protein [Flavobacteriaceae bacterium]
MHVLCSMPYTSIFYQNNLVPADSLLFPASNRAFRYGDGIFESMVWKNDAVRLWPYHYERLQTGAELLKMNCPSKEALENAITQIAQANQLAGTISRVGISLWRSGEGFYAPEDKESEYLVKTTAVEAKYLSPKSLRLGLYQEMKKPITPLSCLKTLNSLLYVMAGIYKTENGLDECIVLNEHDRICEAVSSNIFWMKGDTVYTPAISEGCIAGVMRRHICESIRQNDYQLTEGSFGINEIENADAVFLSNAVSGPIAVGAFLKKKYEMPIPDLGLFLS